MAHVRVFAGTHALFDAGADAVAEAAATAIAARARFTLALSGGTTPRHLFERLASPPWRDRIDWPRVHLFWSDERCVSPTHADSNYRMAREALLDHVPVPAAQVHRMRGEDVPDSAAVNYEAELRATLDAGAPGGPSVFDLVLLGLGADGHTASLFPGMPSGRVSTRWVVAEHVDAARGWRLTLTPPIINAARSVVFLVTGDDKAAALAAVLEGPAQPLALPAQAVASGSSLVTWLVDRAAARLLTRPHAD